MQKIVIKSISLLILALVMIERTNLCAADNQGIDNKITTQQQTAHVASTDEGMVTVNPLHGTNFASSHVTNDCFEVGLENGDGCCCTLCKLWCCCPCVGLQCYRDFLKSK